MENEYRRKSIELTINNIIYTASLYISVNDVSLLANHQNNYKANCDFLLASMIHNHIVTTNQVPSISEIQEDQSAIDSYVKALISANESIKPYYDELSSECNNRIRLLCAINTSCRESMKKSLLAIKAEFSKITCILPDTNTVVQSIRKAVEPLLEVKRKIEESVLAANSYINSLFARIQIPKISDEYKEQLKQSFIAWGRFGWTVFPYATLDFYKTAPKTQKEANDKALVYCRKGYIQSLVEEIEKLKGVNKRDFEEAIFAYNNYKYKSCAMILLSLIDAKLIRMQKKEDGKKNDGSRKNGIGAVKAIAKRIEGENDINSTLLFLMSYSNLFACLEVIFEYGNDFKTQPDIPNRNFIGHGMLTRKVLKRDCIQLFLLYYNLLEFIDIMKE